MLELTSDAVLLDQSADDWRDALTQAGSALTRAGLVDPAYGQSLFQRESEGSTYLGNGIAIPHGTPASRNYVKTTGLRLLQYPDGLEWHDGNRVSLIITIAAANDEHLDILRRLTHVLDAPGVAEGLAAADNAADIIALLSRAPVQARLDRATVAARVPVASREGLAAVAATRLYEAGVAGAGFIGQIMGQTPVSLGDKLWLVEGSADVTQPALGVATPAEVGDAAAVFVLARLPHADEAADDVTRGLLERVLGVLESGEAPRLAQLDTGQLIGRLAGESAGAEVLRVRVRNAHGLHARPAKNLVQIAREQRLPIRVRLESGGADAVSAASLTKVIGLGARRGQMLVFSAEGEGAATALEAIGNAVRSGLGEDVLPLEDTSEARPSRNKTEPRVYAPAPAADTALDAVAASPGMAIAPVFVLRLPEFNYADTSDDSISERKRLDAAIREAYGQLTELIQAADGGDMAEILSMHEEMLRDPELREAAVEAINEGASAEAGWWQAIDASARAQAALADRILAERAADLRDVGRRVLGRLCGVSMPEPPDHPYILVAEDIGPSDVAQLDTQRVRGLLTAKGGATSHSAILARSLGIPAVVGAGESVLSLADGIDMIIDGERGRVVPQPSDDRRARANRAIAERAELEAEAFTARFEPAVTTDNVRIEVGANLGNTSHAADAVERGAEGVGLLRTEFIFMAHPAAPDLDTQVTEYKRAFEALGPGRPLVARTLDVGGDKPLDYWPVPPEDNPFLGLRGIRLALNRPQVLETQMRALITASEGRPLRIMFPMVKDVAEFHQAKAIYDRVVQEFDGVDVQLGVMVEVPSCALLAETLAPHVDFFSIGTNDLTQYTLAIDRGHPRLSGQADGLHPAVLRLILMTVAAAEAHGCWVGVCGELASDAQAVGVLVGLGVHELSVNARQVPLVKARIRRLSQAEVSTRAEALLSLATAAEVREAVEAEQ
ncbi:phosphoenolpyruvate--protein phosphotransferase [Salinisphaera hydrothermalis]|uniref:phosphoenolpyruvate--protein phosphotransferase n=1 Tax=Salinisphaera hydrothermalis (strain C41B8) TaxID=1304275 RepID=A0A084IMM9_SALHC|nr:phosphoenolpyruvate--protein phosphotransferase [Salinisphaera hydrothermalis]KEZ77963.1 multifunctional PTS system fructose-like transporter subunit IIA/phosphocarrier protein HPr/phosphoenolpyruvate-protein phosphotransferase [Salinisphaera hydrothermalis C41B8]